MQADKKYICKIFVAHKSFSDSPLLEQAYDVLKEETGRINREGPQKRLIELELQDFERERGLDNPYASTFQSADSLLKDAANAHAVFILVGENMTPRIGDWYRRQVRHNRREKDENNVPMPIFWNAADPESLKNYRAFRDEFEENCDYIEKYETLEQFREEAAHWLEKLTIRWAARITSGKKVPTLASNRNQRMKKGFFVGLVLAILGFCFYLMWPVLREMREKTDFGKKLAKAEMLVTGQRYEPARDSLLILSEICKPEWEDEKARLDSLTNIVERYFMGVGIDAAEKKIHADKLTEAKASLDSLREVCHVDWVEEIARVDSLKSAVDAKIQAAEDPGTKPDPKPDPKPVSKPNPIPPAANSCKIVSTNRDIVSHVRGALLSDSSLGLSFPVSGETEWVITIRDSAQKSSKKDSRGVTKYKATVNLTATVVKGGVVKGDVKSEGVSLSYEGEEKAASDALKTALDNISSQLRQSLGK